MTSEWISPDGGYGEGQALTFSPEDSMAFRMAQLALLLNVAAEKQSAVRTLDRLAYFDFLAANPYLMLDGDDRRRVDDRHRVRAAGFSSRQLSYNSVGQRFVSRRQRLKHDVAHLISYGLVEIREGGYGLSDAGVEFCDNLGSIYADAYRESATIVFRRLGKSTDSGLANAMRGWLGESWLLLDLLRDVVNPEPGSNYIQNQE